MYSTVNLSILSEILDVNLVCPPKNFNMSQYTGTGECGSTHCLVGNYELSQNRPIHWIDEVTLQERYGISKSEYCFLFTGHHRLFWVAKDSSHSRNAVVLSQKQALTRLAKFIIYKRKKKRLWADFGKARRTEGDNMFCKVTEKELKGELVHV